MDCQAPSQWVAAQKNPHRLENCVRFLIDSCSSYVGNGDVNKKMQEKRMKIIKFPPKVTEELQGCNSFLIQ